MALQMQHMQARDVAQFRDRDRGKRAPSGPEAVDIIESGLQVDFDGLVPIKLIYRHLALHYGLRRK